MGIVFELNVAEKWTPTKSGDSIQGEVLALGAVPWKDTSFPTLTLQDFDGCPWNVNMGCFSLTKVWENPIVQPGGFIAIQYKGESKTIESTGNFAKLYGVAYFGPGDWKYDENGQVQGKQTLLVNSRDSRPQDVTKKAEKLGDWRDVPRVDDGEPLFPEETDSPAKKKTAKSK